MSFVLNHALFAAVVYSTYKLVVSRVNCHLSHQWGSVLKLMCLFDCNLSLDFIAGTSADQS